MRTPLVQTVLGPRRLAHDDEHLSSAHKAAREQAFTEAMAMGAAAKPSSTSTADDVFDLACTLASVGTEDLPRGSHVETTSVDMILPLQRPYGRTYTTICTSLTGIPSTADDPLRGLLCGLLNMAGKLSPSVYERMVKEMPERV
jgi:hypothetical protein